MGETLTLQQLCNNSYHLAIRSSLLAIQSTLSLQESMLQSDHATFTDIKSTITSQNKTLQNTTKTLVEIFYKISSYQPPPMHQSRSIAPPEIQAAPLQTSLSSAPPKSLLPTYIPPPSENSSPATSQQVLFHPPHSEPANNQPLQPNQPKLHIGDSDLDSEKSQPPDDSETISQPPNPDSIEMLDLKAATTLVDLESARVYAGFIADIGPRFNLKPLSLHVETLDESCEEERKYALGDARNMFDKIIKPTELSFQLNKYEISSSTVSIFYLNDPLDCTLIVGENNVYIFDPGGHDLKYNKIGSFEVNTDVTNFSQGMNQVEHTVEIHLVAIKPLYNSLGFAQSNFEYQMGWDHMMSVFGKTDVTKEIEIRQASFECFVAILSIYHEYLEPYMEKLFMLAANAVNNDDESVALQALEFRSSICDEEIEVQEEYCDSGNLVYHSIIRKALTMLVPMLLDTSLKQDEDQDTANWNLSMAGGTCLRLIAKPVGNEIAPLVMPFVESNIPKTEWKNREAATFAFGSILEGPYVRTLSPLFHAESGFLLIAMKDHSCHVKDTAAWTLGRIFEILHYSNSSHLVVTAENLPCIISVLLESMNDTPNVAMKVYGAMYFFVQGYENSESECIFISPQLTRIIASLLSTSDCTNTVSNSLRVSAYETLNDSIKLLIEIMTRQGKKIELQVKMLQDKEKQSEVPTLLHGVLVKDFIKCTKAINDNKTFIFDHGGIFDVHNIVDLEDKVVFEGMAMIRLGMCHHNLKLPNKPGMHTRLRPTK